MPATAAALQYGVVPHPVLRAEAGVRCEAHRPRSYAQLPARQLARVEALARQLRAALLLLAAPRRPGHRGQAVGQPVAELQPRCRRRPPGTAPPVPVPGSAAASLQWPPRPLVVAALAPPPVVAPARPPGPEARGRGRGRPPVAGHRARHQCPGAGPRAEWQASRHPAGRTGCAAACSGGGRPSRGGRRRVPRGCAGIPLGTPPAHAVGGPGSTYRATCRGHEALVVRPWQAGAAARAVHARRAGTWPHLTARRTLA